jgi:tetratricopeptide (TPR) repeat protein
MNIPNDLLEELRQCLVLRKISSGIERLNSCRGLLDAPDARQENSAALVGYLAQWVDVGFGEAKLVKEMLSRFRKPERARLRLTDYVHLRMAESFVAMSQENFDQAADHLRVVLSLEDAIENKELVAIACFWTGRCHRREGRYQDALNYVVRGRRLASELKYPKMSAVMQVLEGWIAFQEEKTGEALRILDEADATLADTDDYLTLGNIQSAYGRIARRQGRFQQALSHFEKAIEQYRQRNSQHNNVARSLVNMAYVKRLLALQLSTRIDSHAARQRNGRSKAKNTVSHKTQERSSFQRLHEEALGHLTDALNIYARYDDHRGTGAIHITHGYVYLDQGDLDRASSKAATAFHLGSQKRDYILRARARILQSAICGAQFDEELEVVSCDHPAQAANDYARDAVEYAKHTQSRRLLAKAYISLGLALSNDFFDDPATARQCCERAATFLNPDNQDYVWRDLQTLKKKLLRTGEMDSTLREWSQGIVGQKTFQQINEEFAGIIIPSVWKHEGRKIARVASRLSISPKKVRRVLRNLGILDRANGDG